MKQKDSEICGVEGCGANATSRIGYAPLCRKHFDKRLTEWNEKHKLCRHCHKPKGEHYNGIWCNAYVDDSRKFEPLPAPAENER